MHIDVTLMDDLVTLGLVGTWLDRDLKLIRQSCHDTIMSPTL